MTHLFIHLKTLGCISSNAPALTWLSYPLQEVSCLYQEPATPAGHLHRRDDCFPDPSGTEKAQKAKGLLTHHVSVDSTSKQNPISEIRNSCSQPLATFEPHLMSQLS